MRTLLLASIIAAGTLQAQVSGLIAPHPRIYVEAADGFDVYVVSALERRHLPVVVTTDRSKADYLLTAQFRTEASSSFEANERLVDLKSGNVIFVYSPDRKYGAGRRQVAAETLAKQFGRALAGSPAKGKSGGRFFKTLAKESVSSQNPALQF